MISKGAKATLLAAGIASSLLGIVVIFGWHLRKELLVQVHPSFVPMQYNTALGFVLLGAALVAFAYDGFRPALALGTGAGLLGFLNLFELLTGVDLGIDRLLVRTDFLMEGMQYPGRMALATAICFPLASVALWLSCWRGRMAHRALTVGLAAALILALGSASLVAKWLGISAVYAWGRFTNIDMAVHTATAFVLLGSAFVVQACYIGRLEHRELRPLRAVLLAFVTALLTFVFVRALEADMHNRLGAAALSTATRLSGDIETRMEFRILALVRMARSWDIRGYPSRDVLETDAMLYAEHDVTARAGMWVDSSYQIRRIVPQAHEHALGGRDVRTLMENPLALEAARTERKVTVDQLKLDGLSSEHFLVSVPRYPEGRFDGFFVGVFAPGALIEHVVDHVAPNYCVSVTAGRAVMRESDCARDTHSEFWAQEANVELSGLPMQVRVWPKPLLFNVMGSDLPGVALVAGLLLSLLVAVTEHAGRLSKVRAMEAESARQKLEREVEIRLAVEGELRHARDALQVRASELETTNRELEILNRELDAFSYSVSHDLRAPLRTIDGFSKILLDQHAHEHSERGRHYIERIRLNTISMGQLVDDLLSFSRLSRLPFQTKTVWPDTIVHEVLADLAGEAESREVDIEVGDLPPCNADASMLRHVYTNLLANALKFTRHRDKTTIRVGATHENGIPTYFVADNGAGFDMNYAGKLFGVFQRLHSAKDYEGTGVGLAIVQRIVHRHGGKIWAEAEPDGGATFFFTLGSSTHRHLSPNSEPIPS